MASATAGAFLLLSTPSPPNVLATRVTNLLIFYLSRRGLDAGTPVFPLKGLASPPHKPASRGLIDLSDRDLRWLSAITRREIEELD